MAASSLDSTALICRPAQLAEAAVVLAALRCDGVVPVIVLEPAPLSRREYDELYAAYTVAREASMQNVVGLEFRAAVEEINMAKVQADIDRHHELHVRLSAPRSWLTHQNRWSELLYAIPCERAIFLFDPTDDDLSLWPTIKAKQFFTDKSGAPVEEFGDKALLPRDTRIIAFVPARGPILSRTVPYVRHTYDGLTGLADVAWDVLRPSEVPVEAALADPADPASILIGLYEALQRSIPLRCSNSVQFPADLVQWRVTGPNDASECVLVENMDSANSIAAVIYARYCRAQFFVCPTPDISRVDEAITQFREDQRQATKAEGIASRLAEVPQPPAELSDAAKTAILKAVAEVEHQPDIENLPKGTSLGDFLRRYVFGDWRGDALREIELAVSANVPAELVDAVGDRPVTVFTSGVPYTFVRSSRHDWCNKPIGHVGSDGPLIVASHVWLSTQTPATAPFVAIFDPGFFKTSETRDVVAAMDRQSAYPIVFSKTAATLDGLRLASELPLVFVFFNTHGTDDAIVLGAQTFENHILKNESLVQWAAFPSAPIIFNNSCLSWRGVGREFVRIGARGYVGTLWPVGEATAARFAARAMRSLVDGASVSAAICQPDVDDETRRAYIYVGIGSCRVLSPATPTDGHRKAYVLGLINRLLDAMLDCSRVLVVDENRDLTRFVLQQVGSFFSRTEVSQAGVAEVYPLRAKQLKVLANLANHIERSEDSQKGILVVISEAFRLAEASHEAAGAQPDDYPELLRARSRIRHNFGDTLGAIADYEASLNATSGGDSDNLIHQVNLADLWKDAGDWTRAHAIAVAAKEKADHSGDREARMRLAGILGQLEKRAGNTDRAIEYAQEGFGLAVELENRQEQAEFKLDEAKIEIEKHNYPAAITAAGLAGTIARACLDLRRNLASHGVMAQALLKCGNSAASRQYAEGGLLAAQRTNDLYEQSGFLFDIGATYQFEGNIALAVKRYRDSLILAGKSGRREMLPAFPGISDLAVTTGDWPLIESILGDHLAIQYQLPPEIRVSSMVAFLNTLRSAVFVGSVKDARQGLRNLLDRCAFLLSSIPSDPGDDIRLAGRTVQMLLAWLTGAPEAHEIARELDEHWTDGRLHWESFVAKQPPA